MEAALILSWNLHLSLAYHASELKACVPNDPILFPSHEHAQPGPIVTDDSLEKFLVQEIIDARP